MMELIFRLKKPIKNPYIEATLQFGNKTICHNGRQRSQLSSICANITEQNWCPESINSIIRQKIETINTWY